MIRFFIKKYFSAIARHRRWLAVVFIPVGIYLLFSAVRPDRFIIYQDLVATAESPLAVSKSPEDYVQLREVTAHPGTFFLDKFALNELFLHIYPDTIINQDIRQVKPLIKIAEKNMSLHMVDNNHVRLEYYGTDRNKGELFVSFYSKRLIKLAAEGLKRVNLRISQEVRISEQPVAGSANKRPLIQGVYEQKHTEPTQESNSTKSIGPILEETKKMIAITEPADGTKIKEQRALWRAERLAPAANIFIFSLAIILLWIVIYEFSDPSLKSVRQVARYLNVPIWGSLPDLEKVSQRLRVKGSMHL